MPSLSDIAGSSDSSTGIRADVEKGAIAFFGGPIAAHERVWQTLETTRDFGGDDQTYVLLESIIRCVPAAAAVFSDLGINVSRIGFPRLRISFPARSIFDHTKAVLGQAFLEDFFDSKTLNSTASKIRKTQQLSIVDFLRGPLESPFNWPGNTPQTMLSSLLYAAGKQPIALSRDEICREASRRHHLQCA